MRDGFGGKHVGARSALEDRHRERVGDECDLEAQRHEAASKRGILLEVSLEVRVARGLLGRSQARERAVHLSDLGNDAHGHFEPGHAFERSDEARRRGIEWGNRAVSGCSARGDLQPTRTLLDHADAPERGLVAAAVEDPAALGQQKLGAADQIEALARDEARPVAAADFLVGRGEEDHVALERAIALGELGQREQVNDRDALRVE